MSYGRGPTIADVILLPEAETHQIAFDFSRFHGLPPAQSKATVGDLTKAQCDGSLMLCRKSSRLPRLN